MHSIYFDKMSTVTGKKKINVKRKIFHSLGLVFPILLEIESQMNATSQASSLTWFPFPLRPLAQIIFISGTISLFLLDILRFRYERINHFFLSTFRVILKKEEEKTFSASIGYLLACFLLVTFLPQTLFFLTCIFLMIADSLAAYIGGHFGHIRFSNSKSIEGLFAFFLFSFGLGIAYLWLQSNLFPSSLNSSSNPFALWKGTGINYPILLSLCIGSFFAAISEFITKPRLNGFIDDNLISPIAGAVGLVVGGVMGGFPLPLLVSFSY